MGVVAHEERQHGDEHQHQREQGEEGVVGDERGLLAGLVVAELLHDADWEPEPGVPALVAIQLRDHTLERVRHGRYVPRPPAINLCASTLARRGRPPHLTTRRAQTRWAPTGSTV